MMHNIFLSIHCNIIIILCLELFLSIFHLNVCVNIYVYEIESKEHKFKINFCPLNIKLKRHS